MSPEKFSPINTVKGVQKEREADVLDEIIKRFETNRTDPSLDREKTAEEVETMTAICQEVADFLAQYGAARKEIPLSHIHVVDRSNMSPAQLNDLERRNPNELGYLHLMSQHIVLFGWRATSSLSLAHTLVHELVHFNGFTALRQTEEGEMTGHQIGLQAFRQGTGPEEIKIYFNELNEAITEELAMRFYNLKLEGIPHLGEEYAEVQRLRKEHDIPDLLAVNVEEFPDAPEGQRVHAKVDLFKYERARKKLWVLIDEIIASRHEAALDRESVFSVFASAAMTGNVKEMAALIEGLGSGRLREIALRKA